jgi:hypothetical protein
VTTISGLCDFDDFIVEGTLRRFSQPAVALTQSGLLVSHLSVYDLFIYL